MNRSALGPPQKRRCLDASGKQRNNLTNSLTGSKENDSLPQTTAADQSFRDDMSMLCDCPSLDAIDKYGATVFLRQCRDGLLIRVQEFEDVRCNIMATDNEGHSAIHYAASGGQSVTISHLVGRGLDPNLKSKRLQTPLHLACLNGHVNVIQLLVEEYKVDVGTEDENGSTPLHSLVKNLQLIDHKELFLLLVKHGANLNAKDKRGRTPLHIAAGENLVEAVEYLIGLGADVDTKDKKGVAPLVTAAVKGRVDVIPKLVEAGADIDCKDRTGQTSLHAACIQGHLEVIEMLLSLNANQAAQDKDGNIPLQRACQYGHLQIVQYLVERGSDVCSLDRNGQTPLHKACKEKDSEERCRLIHYLIDHGAKLNLQSQYARCPLHCTCEEGTPEAALILLKRGAAVNLKDKGGRTPLHYASLGGFSRIPEYNKLITILLDHSADPNDVDKKGLSAVHLATKVGNVEAVRTLLKYHGDPSLLSEEHRSAIHYAVIGDPPKVKPSLEILKLLLDAGGEVNLQDQDGYTPLHYAAQAGNVDMGNMLLQKDTNLFLHTNDQKTAKDLALHARMKNLLLSTKQRNKYSKEGTTPLPVVKLFLTGHIQAGKTELRRHLGDTVCNSSPSLLKRKTEHKERTAGIEIEYLKHDSYGTLVAHDLAGHCEYTTSHSTIIDCSDSSVFIIVFDITKDIVRIKEEVNYWSAFIKAGRNKMSTPWVLLVATHSDVAIAHGRVMRDLSTIYQCIFTEWKSKYSEVFCIADEEFIVNCLEQDSTPMTHLRTTIGDCCRKIRNTHPQIPTLCFELLHVLRSITDSKRPALKVNDAIEHIIKHNSMFASKEAEEKGTLQELLQYLSVMGMVILLKNGWIVVQKEELLENIFAWLFSPEGFFLNDLSDIEHGVVPIERITAVLGKDYDVTLVVDIVCELLLGRKMEDEQAIQIPALLKVKQREAYWTKDEKYKVFGGWRMECQDLTDIFSPSFFPKLQVCLKKDQARRVTLWANGLIFQENRVQALVSVDDCNKKLDILVRGEAGTEEQCYKLRERLQGTVGHHLQECSSGTKYIHKIVRPVDIRDCQSIRSLRTYNLQDVLKEKQDGSATISFDGVHSDTVRELLYCNWDPDIEKFDTEGLAPTDQQLSALANEFEIQSKWYDIGCALGVAKTTLDRIESELENNKGKTRAAFEMLHMAREKPSFSSSAELARKLYTIGIRCDLYWLRGCQNK